MYFIFILDEKYYAVPFSPIEKVIRAVELISVPKSSDNLLGFLNIKGTIIPVVNIRKKLNLPEREIELNDRIVISSISGKSFAFVADGVEGVADSSFKLDSYDKECKETLHQSEETSPTRPEPDDYIEGVGKLNHHTVIIYNIKILL